MVFLGSLVEELAIYLNSNGSVLNFQYFIIFLVSCLTLMSQSDGWANYGLRLHSEDEAC